MFLFFKMYIMLSKKNQYFLEVQPHYNCGKDLKILVSNMLVIWRWNEKQPWLVMIQWK